MSELRNTWYVNLAVAVCFAMGAIVVALTGSAGDRMVSLWSLAGLFVSLTICLHIFAYRERCRWRLLTDLAEAAVNHLPLPEPQKIRKGTIEHTFSRSIYHLTRLLRQEMVARRDEQQRITAAEVESEKDSIKRTLEREKRFFQKVMDSANLYSFIAISMKGKWSAGTTELKIFSAGPRKRRSNGRWHSRLSAMTAAKPPKFSADARKRS